MKGASAACCCNGVREKGEGTQMKAYYSRRARRGCAALALVAGLVFLALAVAALLSPDAGWTVAAVFLTGALCMLGLLLMVLRRRGVAFEIAEAGIRIGDLLIPIEDVEWISASASYTRPVPEAMGGGKAALPFELTGTICISTLERCFSFVGLGRVPELYEELKKRTGNLEIKVQLSGRVRRYLADSRRAEDTL